MRFNAFPQVVGPLFFFHIPHDSLLREIKPTSVVRKSLSEFCDHIRGNCDPPEAYAKITSLKRYQRHKGLKHQFVIMHAQVDLKECPQHARTFWIRIDRSADREATTSTFASSSIFPPDDKVQLTQCRCNAGTLIKDLVRFNCHQISCYSFLIPTHIIYSRKQNTQCSNKLLFVSSPRC